MKGNASRLLVFVCFFVVRTVYAAGPYIAYSNPTGAGNQRSSGVSFGMDFNVISAISVSALGAFDDMQDGLTKSITIAIWDRASMPPAVVPGLSLVISGGDGTVTRGDRIVRLSPVTLPAGFKGSIVASGYGEDQNGNGIASVPNVDFSTPNSGGGLISFENIARQSQSQDPPGSYPTDVTNMSLDAQYGGPTFVFDKQSSRPFLAAIKPFWSLFSIGLVVVFIVILRLRRSRA